MGAIKGFFASPVGKQLVSIVLALLLSYAQHAVNQDATFNTSPIQAITGTAPPDARVDMPLPMPLAPTPSPPTPGGVTVADAVTALGAYVLARAKLHSPKKDAGGA